MVNTRECTVRIPGLWHSCIPAFLRSRIPAFLHSCIPACLHFCIRAFLSVPCTCLAVTLFATPAAAQPVPATTRLAVLLAEDRRATTAADLATLRLGARSRDALTARIAIRALLSAVGLHPVDGAVAQYLPTFITHNPASLWVRVSELTTTSGS